MNRDVFLSLLALDSYNRGYGQNVFLYDGQAVAGQDEIGRGLGTATVSAQTITASAQAAGFYAIANDWNGGTIISAPSSSWRGTSFPEARLAA